MCTHLSITVQYHVLMYSRVLTTMYNTCFYFCYLKIPTVTVILLNITVDLKIPPCVGISQNLVLTGLDSRQHILQVQGRSKITRTERHMVSLFIYIRKHNYCIKYFKLKILSSNYVICFFRSKYHQLYLAQLPYIQCIHFGLCVTEFVHYKLQVKLQ